MDTRGKIEYLIVDTSAFIRNVSLQDMGINIITEQDVVNEITNKRQLRRLVVLPYDLKVQSASPENIKFVTEFSKKTGDYPSLSATDIKVIALTYQLQKEKVGTNHLHETPHIARPIKATIKKNVASGESVVGFYLPKENSTVSHKNESHLKEQTTKDPVREELELSIPWRIKIGYGDYTLLELLDFMDKEKEKEKVDNLEEEVDNLEEKVDNLEEEVDNLEEEVDDNDWITPSNIINVKKKMENSSVEEKKPATVACLTTDFAMQNVLMQIGLNVSSLDGKVIKQMRTFILRCYACFKTTSIMTKVFCPNCGNKTLKKVSVVLDDKGNQQICINTRKPLSAKGKKFSLPTPKGGKHANNPILCEDQPVPQQRISKLARTKNNPLQEDYIAGYSPFIMRDVSSKSAMLGIRPDSTIKYWMKKNPNEPRRKKN